MTAPYDGPTYTATEFSLFALNGLLEREYVEVFELLDELTDYEARMVLPVLLTVAVRGLAYLDPERMDAWRALTRGYLDEPQPTKGPR